MILLPPLWAMGKCPQLGKSKGPGSNQTISKRHCGSTNTKSILLSASGLAMHMALSRGGPSGIWCAMKKGSVGVPAVAQWDKNLTAVTWVAAEVQV